MKKREGEKTKLMKTGQIKNSILSIFMVSLVLKLLNLQHPIFNKLQLFKTKNLSPQLPWPYFNYSVATCGQWLRVALNSKEHSHHTRQCCSNWLQKRGYFCRYSKSLLLCLFFSFFFKLRQSHYVTIAGMEPSMQTKLISNTQKSA